MILSSGSPRLRGHSLVLRDPQSEVDMTLSSGSPRVRGTQPCPQGAPVETRRKHTSWL